MEKEQRDITQEYLYSITANLKTRPETVSSKSWTIPTIYYRALFYTLSLVLQKGLSRSIRKKGELKYSLLVVQTEVSQDL